MWLRQLFLPGNLSNISQGYDMQTCHMLNSSKPLFVNRAPDIIYVTFQLILKRQQKVH